MRTFFIQVAFYKATDVPFRSSARFFSRRPSLRSRFSAFRRIRLYPPPTTLLPEHEHQDAQTPLREPHGQQQDVERER
jgi:hypothetical protein